MSKFKVGDKVSIVVYPRWSGGPPSNIMVGEVVRITPKTGRVTARFGDFEVGFTARGDEIGGSNLLRPYDKHEIETMQAWQNVYKRYSYLESALHGPENTDHEVVSEALQAYRIALNTWNEFRARSGE